jgi:hypothetical protein
MSSIDTRRPKFLRSPRKIAAVFVMAMYLLAGALHTLCDLDVTSASGNTAISINKDVGQSEKSVVAEHHCHGCFSVSVPAPTIAEVGVVPTREAVVLRDTQGHGIAPGIDPPPPKFLT